MNSLAVAEVLGLEARLFARLPARASMVWRESVLGAALVVSTSQVHCEAARRLGHAVFGELEIEALIVAAERDRATAPVLARWCAYKRNAPTWRLELDEALGGVRAGVRTPPTMGRVVQAFAAELVRVTVEGDRPDPNDFGRLRTKRSDFPIGVRR